jgi:chromosome partitioning protein
MTKSEHRERASKIFRAMRETAMTGEADENSAAPLSPEASTADSTFLPASAPGRTPPTVGEIRGLLAEANPRTRQREGTGHNVTVKDRAITADEDNSVDGATLPGARLAAAKSTGDVVEPTEERVARREDELLPDVAALVGQPGSPRGMGLHARDREAVDMEKVTDPVAGTNPALEHLRNATHELDAGRDLGAMPVGKPPLPRVLAIANQKGGVGKTTTAVNLGAALAELGYRLLVVDLDPQGNATTGLGVNARNLETSVYDVILHDVPIEDCIEPTNLRNLFLVPATIDLAGAEIELVPAFSRELRLKRALDTVLDDFDFVLIDCPPSLGLLTVNALTAANEVAVPIQCEYYALEGLSQLLRNVKLVSSNLNETLEVSTIVLTMFDSRTRLSVDVANEVREHFGERVCHIVIPRTVRLSEAPSFGQPITVFDPASRGAVAYRELAKEVSNGAPQRTR